MNKKHFNRQSLDGFSSARGFTLAELMIAMGVFTLIMGSVLMLLGKSQSIFRTEQGVAEMDQNARMLMDFMTRDVQQAKENGLGLGPKFRSIYSSNGTGGLTDEVTIISSDTKTDIPSEALPLIPATRADFTAYDGYLEVLPNGAGAAEPHDILRTLKPNEEFIVSSTLSNGSVQFDFIKVRSARITRDGTVGLSFSPVSHHGVEPEISFGSRYENGAFSMRPVSIKRYFVDRNNEKEHPQFSLSINEGQPITIARNIVAFQLRYLEVKDGEVEGQWVNEQNISRNYKTIAVEVTTTASTEIKGDEQAERLVTLASVIRPRLLPGGAFGNSGGSDTNLGLPGGDGSGGPGGGGPGGPGGSGGRGGPGGGGYGPGGGSGPGDGSGYGSGSGGSSGYGSDPYKRKTIRIGKPPKLGERLNPKP